MTKAASPPAAIMVKERGSLWLWLIPVLAAIATGAFACDAWRQRGPSITVDFANGAGIAPGDPVMLRGVRIGDVTSVTMKPDLGGVRVGARLRKDAAGLAVDGSSFWIVRPEISAGRVSGLDTLLGPRYLQCRPGSGSATLHFAGLARPPISQESGGLEIVIEASQSTSLGVDTPIVYRGVKVGAVLDVALSRDARKVEITALIEAPYRNLVRANSRFWNAGGIGVDWGLLRGLKVQAGTLESLVVGGIAFATPTKPGEQAEPGRRFSLEVMKEEWQEWVPALDVQPEASR